MYRVDQDSFAREIALELSGVWNKIDFCWQVKCPTCAAHHAKCADRKQARIIKGTRGSLFLDIYKLTSTEDGENNNLHMCDNYHLSPKCLSILFENYLYKS